MGRKRVRENTDEIEGGSVDTAQSEHGFPRKRQRENASVTSVVADPNSVTSNETSANSSKQEESAQVETKSISKTKKKEIEEERTYGTFELNCNVRVFEYARKQAPKIVFRHEKLQGSTLEDFKQSVFEQFKKHIVAVTKMELVEGTRSYKWVLVPGAEINMENCGSYMELYRKRNRKVERSSLSQLTFKEFKRFKKYEGYTELKIYECGPDIDKTSFLKLTNAEDIAYQVEAPKTRVEAGKVRYRTTIVEKLMEKFSGEWTGLTKSMWTMWASDIIATHPKPSHLRVIEEYEAPPDHILPFFRVVNSPLESLNLSQRHQLSVRLVEGITSQVHVFEEFVSTMDTQFKQLLKDSRQLIGKEDFSIIAEPEDGNNANQNTEAK